MKKIGIMSMQKVKNYGSFLQAFALKKILSEISAGDVQFVDFHTEKNILDPPSESLIALKKTPKKYFLIRLASIFSHFPLINKNKKIRDAGNLFSFYRLYCKRFASEFWPLLNISKKENYSDSKMDLLVIGSDEVFNLQEARKAGYSEELFGKGACADRLVSFAGSFGCTRLEDLQKNNDDDLLKKYFNKFQAVSVRDKNSEKIVFALTGTKPEYHLDPVFHYDFHPFMPHIRFSKPYLAVYAYTNGFSESMKQAIINYAQANHLEILCFMGYQTGIGRFMNVSPFEMLSYLKNAACVVTNTFHGCVFSLKFNKQFCAIVQHREGNGYGNDEKMGDLLNRTEMNHVMIDNDNELQNVLDNKIDYQSINEYIRKSTQSGIYYLREQVREIQNTEEIV